MDDHNKYNCEFTGKCHKCGLRIRGCDSACQAMGNLYHARCFICYMCGTELKGHEFYRIEEKVYCKEDYKRSVHYRHPQRCYSCKEIIGDGILQTLGRSYHPNCFRCSECDMQLEGTPFTVDKQEIVYCVPDYHRKYSPRCDHCRQPIVPQKESDEIVRVMCLGKQYHEDCFQCEDCGVQLSNEEGKQCYPFERRLYCLTCNERRHKAAPIPPQRTVHSTSHTTYSNATTYSNPTTYSNATTYSKPRHR